MFHPRLLRAVLVCALALVLVPAGVVTHASAIASEAPATNAPWLAKVLNGNASCTGALVSPVAVITAKHCVTAGGAGTVQLGENGSRRVKYSDTVVHPEGDLAIVRLDEVVVDRVPVAVPALIPPPVGAAVVQRGWGKGRFPARQAEGQVTEIGGGESGAQWIYVKSADGSGSTEAGDSGGPLTVDGILVGVLRGKHWSSTKGESDFYTNLAAVNGWIYANILRTGIGV